ncbi:hypothetical protein [Pontiella agarivorans]|uniref:Uncharacterized protein n=1 Tax=Pontiella agarivorans TaxID=3038953 RepID=A0ABU5MXE6_9BACT|nr:hypothetical protein [Pontiella agarivorans]MDZ8118879.1 hypothetical protein [Pontiella agarivorans]
MKIRTGIAAGLGALVLAGSTALAEVRVEINDIKIEDTVYTPYYQAVTEQDNEQGASRKWIRLGVYFTTEGGWIDELDVTQMALLDCGSKSCLALAETVNYINIEPGDHVVYVYLHPSYVKRYDIDGFDLDSAALLKVDGELVARKETNRRFEKGWSEGDIAAGAKGYLLNHAETPFWFINYDFQEIIKRQK